MSHLGCFREFLHHFEQIFKVGEPYTACWAGGLISTLWACSPENALLFLDVKQGKKVRIVLDHVSEDWRYIVIINSFCNSAGYRQANKHLQ